MYELKINNHPVGVFKSLRAARAYKPTLDDAMKAGIGENGIFYRIITKLRATRVNSPAHLRPKSTGAQNERV